MKNIEARLAKLENSFEIPRPATGGAPRANPARPFRRNHTHLTVATFLTAIAGMPLGLPGQDLSIGAIGGGSLTDAVQTETAYNIRTWSQSKDWTAGAMFELRFGSGFSVEVDAMYRELHATIASVEGLPCISGAAPRTATTATSLNNFGSC